MLHGKYGEDGTIQGLFELAQIPYVGNGVLSSSVSMDKAFTKIIAKNAKITQAKYVEVHSEDFNKIKSIATKIEKKLDYPCFVKPANAGSSVGITKAHNKDELIEGLKLAAVHDRKIVVEEGIVGREIECAVLGNGDNISASCVGEIFAAAEFYDYDAKYNNTEEYQLLMHYNHSVETGWLSPLAGFDLYKSTHERIQTELVGKTVADGTVITGHTAHFMERMFGTLVDPKKLKKDLKIVRRSGADFDDIKDTLMHPVMPPRTKKDILGRNSTVFFGKNAQVSVNEKGELIQCEPKKRGDRIGKNE